MLVMIMAYTYYVGGSPLFAEQLNNNHSCIREELLVGSRNAGSATAYTSFSLTNYINGSFLQSGSLNFDGSALYAFETQIQGNCGSAVTGAIITGVGSDYVNATGSFLRSGSLINNDSIHLTNAIILDLNAGSGLVSSSRIKWSNFHQDTGSGFLFYHDSANNRYVSPAVDNGSCFFVEIYAGSLNTGSFTINDCKINRTDTGGSWVVSCVGSSYENCRANVWKTLLYGTDGTKPALATVYLPTALKSVDSREVGLKGYYGRFYYLGSPGAHQINNGSFTFVPTAGSATGSMYGQYYIYSHHGYGYSTVSDCVAEVNFGTAGSLLNTPNENTTSSYDGTATPLSGQSALVTPFLYHYSVSSGGTLETRLYWLSPATYVGSFSYTAFDPLDAGSTFTDFSSAYSIPTITQSALSSATHILLFPVGTVTGSETVSLLYYGSTVTSGASDTCYLTYGDWDSKLAITPKTITNVDQTYTKVAGQPVFVTIRHTKVNLGSTDYFNTIGVFKD